MTLLPTEFLKAPLAHRALHDVTDGRPENSRAAIRAAMDHGYGIEIDVQLSADGAAMVFHDYDLDRLTGQTGPLQRHKSDALGAVPLTGGTEGIPTLQEVLALVDGKVPLLIEIKDQDGGMGPDVGPLEQAVAVQTDAYAGPLAVMSFNPHAMAEMRRLCPNLPLGLVTSAYTAQDWPLPKETRDRLRDIPDFDRIGASFISHEVEDLDRPRVADLRGQGAAILCWTVKSAQQEAQARRHAQNVTFEGYLAALPT